MHLLNAFLKLNLPVLMWNSSPARQMLIVKITKGIKTKNVISETYETLMNAENISKYEENVFVLHASKNEIGLYMSKKPTNILTGKVKIISLKKFLKKYL